MSFTYVKDSYVTFSYANARVCLSKSPFSHYKGNIDILFSMITFHVLIIDIHRGWPLVIR